MTVLPFNSDARLAGILWQFFVIAAAAKRSSTAAPSCSSPCRPWLRHRLRGKGNDEEPGVRGETRWAWQPRELWQSATAALFILVFSACHTPAAPQYEPVALAADGWHAVAIRSFRITDPSRQYNGSVDYGDLVEKYLASELQKDGLSVQLLPQVHQYRPGHA